MTDTRPLVLVDDREPDSAVGRLQDFGVVAVQTRLEAGDYCFYAHGLTCLVERKTASNLLQSLSDKQMVLQAHKLVDSGSVAFLLREGWINRGPGGQVVYFSPRDPRADSAGWVVSGWSWDSFQGMMIDLQMMGIRIVDCALGEYVTEIVRLAINLAKDEHRWIKDRQRPEVVTLDKQWRNDVWSLAAHDHIGVDSAEALLREFGSEYNVVRAAVEDPDRVAKVKIGKGERKRALGKKAATSLGEELAETWTSI